MKIFGEAASGAHFVPVELSAETSVKADSGGGYRLIIDTSGIPVGDYRIECPGEVKVLRIGGIGEQVQAMKISTPGNNSSITGSVEPGKFTNTTNNANGKGLIGDAIDSVKGWFGFGG